MAHSTSKETLSPADKAMIDLLQHGDDFLKIELLRPAKTYYERALGLDPDNKDISEKIKECDRMLAFERKVIWILAGIAAAIVIGYFMFRS